MEKKTQKDFRRPLEVLLASDVMLIFEEHGTGGRV